MAQYEKAGAPVDGVNEVERLTPSGTISGGSFTITYGGQETAAIAWDATAAVIQAALEALSNITPGDVIVTGGPINSSTVDIEFDGLLGGLDVTQVTVDDALLTGSTPAITPSTVTAGVLGSFRGADPGAEMIDTTAGQAYRNSGTISTPVWVPVGPRSAADSRYTPPTQPHGAFVDELHDLGPITT